jgi:glutathione S-transferase
MVMSEFVVYGAPGSPYVRSVLLALHEKRAPYRLASLGPGSIGVRSPEHLALHPFGRMPILEHGDFQLYETQAILRYLDTVLPGPALTPREPRLAARMNQVAGIVDWYVFPNISVGISAERLMSQRFWGRGPDEANIAKSLPPARICVAELVRLLGSSPFLAGPELSIADLMAAPHLLFVRGTPEGEALLAGTPLERWLTSMRSRDSVRDTEVQRLLAAA